MQKNMLWYRENDSSYNVDDTVVKKEEFENKYKSLIQEQLFDSNDWIFIIRGDSIEGTEK